MSDMHNNHQGPRLVDIRKEYMENKIGAKKSREDVELCLPVALGGVALCVLDKILGLSGNILEVAGYVTGVVGFGFVAAGEFFLGWEKVRNKDLIEIHDEIMEEELKDIDKKFKGLGTVYDSNFEVPICTITSIEDEMCVIPIGIDGSGKKEQIVHFELEDTEMEICAERVIG
ncbi:MAG: hypothetical protein N4A47_06010 [Clostridia bacterium]|jgi:hypothetical protein|nr:hypothetical protein [Clostridia bacterium]